MNLLSTARTIARPLLRSTALACAVACSLGSAPALALDVYMRVGQYTQTMPDGTSVTMWGYRVANTQNAALNGALQSPGAAITVPPNDSTLRIRLLNRLPVPTSIVVHGQTTTMAPVFKRNATVNAVSVTSDCTPGTSLDCRVRSFTRETPPGNTTPVDYVYTDVKPGTYLYQSGTLPQIQVQMGLYGMVRKYAPATATSGFNAYPNVPVDNDISLLFSEVDPALHAAVASGTFSGSTLAYDPKYFRVHRYGTATPFANPVDDTATPSNGPTTIQPGQRLLLRMLNAGLQSHSMVLDDGHWYVMAEDGNPYPYPREQYSVFLPAAKTADVWMTPTVGNASAVDRLMTVFDRNLALTNNNAQPVGGLMYQMRVDDTNLLPTLDISNCPLGGTQNQAYGCTVVGLAVGTTTFSLDIAPVGMSIDPVTGAISWVPTNDQAQRPADPAVTNPLRVRATGSNGGIAVSPIVQIAVANVNDPPLAINDSYTVRGGALTVGALQSVRANDSDPDGDALGAVTLVSGPSAAGDSLTLNPDGTFAFTTTNYATDRVATFSYQVTDGAALSNVATVSLNVKANVAPTANEDTVAVVFALPPVPLDIDVLANDFDLDNNLAPATLEIVGPPSMGGTAVVVPGAGPGGRPVIRYTPPPTFRGTDTLTYTVGDTLGAKATPAALRVNIQ
jgi:hypothetical protein